MGGGGGGALGGGGGGQGGCEWRSEAFVKVLMNSIHREVNYIGGLGIEYDDVKFMLHSQ